MQSCHMSHKIMQTRGGNLGQKKTIKLSQLSQLTHCAQRPQYSTFDQNFNLRRDPQKKFLWASRLWVGRRKEPILGYVPKKDEKKNLVHKGLNKCIEFCNAVNILLVDNNMKNYFCIMLLFQSNWLTIFLQTICNLFNHLGISNFNLPIPDLKFLLFIERTVMVNFLCSCYIKGVMYLMVQNNKKLNVI